MKQGKRIFLMLLVFLLVLGTLTGCDDETITTVNAENPQEVYDLLVDRGYKGSFEEWLDSLIKARWNLENSDETT